MLQVRAILFPTDGSTCAEFAHAHAAFLARQFDAELHILHIVEARMNTLDDLSDLVEIEEQDILEQLHAPLPSTTSGPDEARIHRAKRTDASAAEGVLTYAADEDIDLIVMGTHGRRGMDRLLMGSIAEEVVRLSPCPTLTVCGKKQPEPDRDINRILVPMGLSEHTESLFAHARAIGATYGARLDLVHVIERAAFPSVYGVDAPSTDDAAVERRVRDALEPYVEAAQDMDVDATITVLRGHPAAALLDMLDDAAIDLVTIATHGRTGLQRLVMGSVAEKVVRMAPCPVFTVKSFGKSLVASSPTKTARSVHPSE